MTEWDVGMFKWAGGCGRRLSLSGQAAGGGPSVVKLVGHRLVEAELWDGLGLGSPNGPFGSEGTVDREAQGTMCGEWRSR